MKRIITIVIFLIGITVSSFGQIEVSKFGFTKDSPFGCCPNRKGTGIGFKLTGNKTAKYVKVHYVGVNQVNDAVSSDIVGAVNANAKHTKYTILLLTGPFEPNKKHSKWTSNTFHYPMRVTAFPHKITITYMDGAEEEITITKDNIKQYFPKLKWIDVNYSDGI